MRFMLTRERGHLFIIDNMNRGTYLEGLLDTPENHTHLAAVVTTLNLLVELHTLPSHRVDN